MFKEIILKEEYKKYLLIIGTVVAISLVLIVVTQFILKPKRPEPIGSQPPSLPENITPGSPEEAAVRFLQLKQEGFTIEAEQYLLDPNSVEVFGENYRLVRNLPSSLSQGEEGAKNEESITPEYKIKSSDTDKGFAYVTLEEETNKNAGILFFGFALPKKIIFRVDLVKDGDEWKIIKIDAPNLVLQRKLKEGAEIENNVFIKLIKMEDYSLKDLQPPEGFKFLSLEIEYDNKSGKSVNIDPLGEWRLTTYKGDILYPLNERTGSKKLRTSVEINGVKGPK